MKEYNTMKALHQIRAKHHERTKAMPLKKIIADISRRASEIERKHHLNLEKIGARENFNVGRGMGERQHPPHQ